MPKATLRLTDYSTEPRSLHWIGSFVTVYCIYIKMAWFSGDRTLLVFMIRRPEKTEIQTSIPVLCDECFSESGLSHVVRAQIPKS